jgi:hypothetical protein
MAHIIERQRSDGSAAYLTQIDIKRKGVRIHREARIFDTRTAAMKRIALRMKVIKETGSGLSTLRNRGTTLFDAIDKSVDESELEIGRTKAQVLRAVKEYDIADMPCSEIESHHIVAFAKELRTSRTGNRTKLSVAPQFDNCDRPPCVGHRTGPPGD